MSGHKTEENPITVVGLVLEKELQEEEQEDTLDLRIVPPVLHKKDARLHVEVINAGQETGRDVVVSVEYAGGTYGEDPPKTGKQNQVIKKGWKNREKLLVTFTLPNDDCWNPHLLLDVTVDTGGDSEKNKTIIVDKKDK